MRVKLRNAAAALSISGALLASPASAITMDLGVLDPQGSDIGNYFWRLFGIGSPLGEFVDSYTFSLLDAADTIGGTTVYERGLIDLTLKYVSLSSASPASTLYDYTPDAFNFDNLAAGAYTLNVAGTLRGLVGDAKYEGYIRTAASRISEPGTLALLMASLGLLAYWRRKR